MSTFTLDTSGAVALPHAAHGQTFCSTLWSDLTPFQQGYAAEALRALYTEQVRAVLAIGSQEQPRLYAFSDLAPEALALILKDCEANLKGRLRPKPADADDREAGRQFWEDRQRARWPLWMPPLTVTLGDDGKIHLKETGQ